MSSRTDWHRVGQAGRLAKRCQALSARLIGRVSLLMMGMDVRDDLRRDWLPKVLLGGRGGQLCCSF